ncbi:1,4-alpha-glucan branching enzyme [Bacteroidales bacterium]|nr:1,4-alpha-glucan branching enzyme [Bacteroidales bacterium]
METLNILKNDPWLLPFQEAIVGRYVSAQQKENLLTQNGKISLAEFASGHLYFGLHKQADSWVFREWAPNANAIYLVGDFNNWHEKQNFSLHPTGNGNWEITLPLDALHHGQLYKLHIHWENGRGERIPAWSRRVVQDDRTHIFSAQVWDPSSAYSFKIKDFIPDTSPLLIYECHIGMATEEEKVGTYNEFRENVLPRIIKSGYNAIQIMAIQEHPYYGSFGYHVSSFFAPSSRFGTPEELKALIDEAHSSGISVIMDIVHSHAVKNDIEGLGQFDGSYHQYFHTGSRRLHPAWDSLCFDYEKNPVLHFLLSNCKYWLEEFNFDGFRFDGVTSMLYNSHGLEETFSAYEDYFNGYQDVDAINYLMLANKLIHEVNPHAISIAEEVSGMPGLASSLADGGFGFDYRMALNIPDFWIKTLKEKRDQDWLPTAIWWELTNRRQDEKTINYAESHDQALVGDKTLIFWLIDDQMYWHMAKGDLNLAVDRGIALHKMIRLATASSMNGGYLNFIGNEFGHPEWIDFPRKDNNWSYKYTRRQWSLVDNKDLKYCYLDSFDKEMIRLIKSIKNFQASDIVKRWENDKDQVLAFQREDLVFVFNFNPNQSFADYGILCELADYKLALSSDDPAFGGFDRVNVGLEYSAIADPLYEKEEKGWLRLYLPARTALVFKKAYK